MGFLSCVCVEVFFWLDPAGSSRQRITHKSRFDILKSAITSRPIFCSRARVCTIKLSCDGEHSWFSSSHFLKPLLRPQSFFWRNESNFAGKLSINSHLAERRAIYLELCSNLIAERKMSELHKSQSWDYSSFLIGVFRLIGESARTPRLDARSADFLCKDQVGRLLFTIFCVFKRPYAVHGSAYLPASAFWSWSSNNQTFFYVYASKENPNHGRDKSLAAQWR